MRFNLTVPRLAVFAMLPALLLVPPTAEAQRSIYRSVGGYEMLAALTDGMLERAVADPQLSDLFVDGDAYRDARRRQLLVDALCWATGGPCIDLCPDLQASFDGDSFDDARWGRLMVHMTAEANRLGLPERKQQLLVDALEKVREVLRGESC